jgi:hypothetical protein
VRGSPSTPPRDRISADVIAPFGCCRPYGARPGLRPDLGAGCLLARSSRRGDRSPHVGLANDTSSASQSPPASPVAPSTVPAWHSQAMPSNVHLPTDEPKQTKRRAGSCLEAEDRGPGFSLVTVRNSLDPRNTLRLEPKPQGCRRRRRRRRGKTPATARPLHGGPPNPGDTRDGHDAGSGPRTGGGDVRNEPDRRTVQSLAGRGCPSESRQGQSSYSV